MHRADAFIYGMRAGKTYLHRCITLLWIHTRMCWLAARPWDRAR